MLNYLSADYELIEVLGAEADMINVWQSHDCPQYTMAIEVEEDTYLGGYHPSELHTGIGGVPS